MTSKPNRLMGDDTPGHAQSGRDPRPGEIVTIFIKDSEPIVFTRTHRAYAYDLADAYNARRRNEHAPWWYVDHVGNIKPGEPPRSRDVWKPEPGEIEATNQVAARAVAAGVSAEEWTRLVNNGGITKEVFRTMRENVAQASEEKAA